MNAKTETRSVVLITGAAGGVGSALVARFIAGGWAVFATDANATGLAELGQCHTLAGSEAADIRSPAACRTVVQAAVAATGRLDAVINAAGYGVKVRWKRSARKTSIWCWMSISRPASSSAPQRLTT